VAVKLMLPREMPLISARSCARDAYRGAPITLCLQCLQSTQRLRALACLN